MRTFIETRLVALGIPVGRFTQAMGLDGYTPRQILEALSQGIIDEITTNAVTTQPNDSRGDTQANGAVT